MTAPGATTGRQGGATVGRSWSRLLAHQLQLDMRRARWPLLVALLLVGALAWHAWPAHRPASEAAVVLRPFLWLALVLVAVRVVLQAAPARPDGWLAAKPVPPSVLQASALLLGIGAVVGSLTVATLAQLVAFGVPVGDLGPLVGPHARTVALWLVAAMTAASQARCLRQFLLGAIVAGVTVVPLVEVMPPPLRHLHIPTTPWRWLMGACVGVLLLLQWQGYHRRWGGGIGMPLAWVAALVLGYVASHGPPEPLPQLPPLPRGALDVMVDDLRVRPDVGQDDPDATTPEPPETAWLAPDIPAITTRKGYEGNLPVQLRVRVRGGPASGQVLLGNVTLRLVREDGGILELWVSRDVELFRSAVPAVAGRRWRGDAPGTMAEALLEFRVSRSQRARLAQHVAGVPGARLQRAEFTGWVQVRRQQLLATLPLDSTGRAQAPGLRLTARAQREAKDPHLVLSAREVSEWMARQARPQLELGVDGYVLNAAGTEAVQLWSGGRPHFMRLSILPQVGGTHRLWALRPNRASGMRLDDPWFRGATLLLLGWEPVGTMVVRTAVAVPR